MRLKAERLEDHLKREPLAPVYLISGDETLLVQEAADLIRKSAAQQGFSDRELFHTDASFDWNQVLTEANSLSLFAAKKILEIRIPNGKPGDKGSKLLQEYLDNPNPDTLLLIITPKLDGSATRSKWVKMIESVGAFIQVWPVNAAQLPRWIGDRLTRAGIRANSQAIEILADRVEGNLLAAVQEIEKLKLLVPDGEVDGKTMSNVVADSARYDVFTLVDKALAGDAQGASRTLRGLRDEGSEPTVILWSLSREIRTLLTAALAQAQGEHLDWALKNAGVWDKRKPLVKAALRRLPHSTLRQLLRQCGGIDRAIKGMRSADPWDELSTVVLMLCASTPMKPANIRLSLQSA